MIKTCILYIFWKIINISIHIDISQYSFRYNVTPNGQSMTALAFEYIMWWSIILQEALTKEKEELEARMKEELEDQLQVKEATLMEYLEHQRQTLLKEKLEVEEKLQKELETAREHDFKKMAEELELQKQNLEKVMIALVQKLWRKKIMLNSTCS